MKIFKVASWPIWLVRDFLYNLSWLQEPTGFDESEEEVYPPLLQDVWARIGSRTTLFLIGVSSYWLHWEIQWSRATFVAVYLFVGVFLQEDEKKFEKKEKPKGIGFSLATKYLFTGYLVALALGF